MRRWNMRSEQSPEERLIEAAGHVLVTGGPGSGKTTIALSKALAAIKSGLRPEQSVLFLSFSRAAVARLVQASIRRIPRESRGALSIQTFHSFCWDLLSCHGYLLGAPKTLRILLPHDEKALSSGATPESPHWAAWEAERERLFLEEGRIAFDLFAPKTLELLTRSALIKDLVVRRYPLIIVDEAQDTGEPSWQIVRELREGAQIICLGDLEQQIFDHLPGVGPERIATIRRDLQPLEIDLGQTNNRSPDTEIAIFASDILAGRARGRPYNGVERLLYAPKSDLAVVLRRALGIIYSRIRSRTGARTESVAILAPTGRDVAWISAALMSGTKPVPHKVIFDEVQALLASRFAAYLLEPKTASGVQESVYVALELLASFYRASGTVGGRKTSGKLSNWARTLNGNKNVTKVRVITELTQLMRRLCDVRFTGDPRADWIKVKLLLRDCPNKLLKEVAGHLDYLVAFGRGRCLAANLSALWLEEGAYVGATRAFDAAMAQETILETSDDQRGIQVMTIHRSKGKQFDGVILVRRGIPLRNKRWGSSFVWRDDPAPHTRSRRVLRVGITRAQKYVLLLDPAFPQCPILKGHVL